MRQASKTQTEACLRRVFDANVIKDLLYFETAVFVEARSLQPKGYFVFMVCRSGMFIVQIDEVKMTAIDKAVFVPFLNTTAVEQLQDNAKFLEDAVARDSQHIRLSVDDQVAVPDTVDFYTFFADTHLFAHLHAAWFSARVQQAWPSLYVASLCRAAFNLDASASIQLFNAMLARLSGSDASLEKAFVFEEFAMVVGANADFKRHAFQSSEFQVQVLNALKSAHQIRASRLLEASTDMITEDAVQTHEAGLSLYAGVLLTLFQLFSGGATVPERVDMFQNTSVFKVETFVTALLCLSSEEIPPADNVQVATPSPATSPPPLTRVPSPRLRMPLALPRVPSPIRFSLANDDTVTIREEQMSVGMKKITEVDHLQSAVLFELFRYLDVVPHIATPGRGPVVSLPDSGALVRIVVDMPEFCDKRVPRWFARIPHLLRVPAAPHHGCLLYMHASNLLTICQASPAARDIIRKQCFAEIQLLGGGLAGRRAATKDDTFFYALGKSTVQTLLDEILNDVAINAVN